MTRRYGIAVIGAGDMGGKHTEAWQLAGHDVVSVTDVDAARAQELATARGVETIHQDYAQAVDDGNVDIV